MNNMLKNKFVQEINLHITVDKIYNNKQIIKTEIKLNKEEGSKGNNKIKEQNRKQRKTNLLKRQRLTYRKDFPKTIFNCLLKRFILRQGVSLMKDKLQSLRLF